MCPRCQRGTCDVWNFSSTGTSFASCTRDPSPTFLLAGCQSHRCEPLYCLSRARGIRTRRETVLETVRHNLRFTLSCIASKKQERPPGFLLVTFGLLILVPGYRRGAWVRLAQRLLQFICRSLNIPRTGVRKDTTERAGEAQLRMRLGGTGGGVGVHRG
jgi:hypothetical protein